jgi:hypothetical protein
MEDRKRLLKHRARADRLELELMNSRDAAEERLDAVSSEANKQITELGAELRTLRAQREGEKTANTNAAMMHRQEVARLRTQIERLVECLNNGTVAEGDGVFDWLALVSHEDKWQAWRAATLRAEMQTEGRVIASNRAGVAFAVVASGGTGGVGGAALPVWARRDDLTARGEPGAPE